MTTFPAATPQQYGASVAGVDTDALRAAVDAAFATTVAQLKDLVAIPGIAWASFDPAPLDASAEAVASLVRAAGIADVRILRCDKEDGTPGGPAVVLTSTHDAADFGDEIARCGARGFLPKAAFSTDKITARSMRFSSSRTLPG